MSKHTKANEFAYRRVKQAYRGLAAASRGLERYPDGELAQWARTNEFGMLCARMLVDMQCRTGPGYESQEALWGHDYFNCSDPDPDAFKPVDAPKSERDFLLNAVHAVVVLEELARAPGLPRALRKLLASDIDKGTQARTLLFIGAQWGRKRAAGLQH